MSNLEKNLILSIISMIIGLIAFVLCVYWFGWKALLVISLWTGANNINQKIDRGDYE